MYVSYLGSKCLPYFEWMRIPLAPASHYKHMKLHILVILYNRCCAYGIMYVYVNVLVSMVQLSTAESKRSTVSIDTSSAVSNRVSWESKSPILATAAGGGTSPNSKVSELDEADFSSSFILSLHRNRGGVNERVRGGDRDRLRLRLLVFSSLHAPASLWSRPASWYMYIYIYICACVLFFIMCCPDARVWFCQVPNTSKTVTGDVTKT